MARILIVEDDILINELITKNLTLVGHSCLSAYDGVTALCLFEKNVIDLVILDVMLPEMSGFEVITKITSSPVIFVTAKNDVNDRVKGLALGADDYIVKPFAMSELIARVRAVLRRTKRDENFFKLDGLAVDFERQKAYVNNTEVELTAKEFSLLDFLLTNRNITLSRDKIIDVVWGYDYEGDSTRVVDVYVQQLRHKLHLKDRIKSVYGIGYRMEV